MARSVATKKVTRKSSPKLYTIGYENCEIDEFVKGLQTQKIKTVADLRKNPVSRKPGFAKSRLAAALSAVGIEYLHIPELGVPTEWRKAQKADLITRAKMFSDYRKKILPKATPQLSLLKSFIPKTKLALLCYENDASDCHRRYVSDMIAAKKNVIDLDMIAISRRARSALRSKTLPTDPERT